MRKKLKSDRLLGAAKAGKSINLLIGLNPSTCPQALKLVFGVPNITVRYFTSRFHAKIFIFDDHVLVGSSNLTEGGLFGNREATVCLNTQADFQRIEDLKAIFADLWNAAETLSEGILNTFRLTLDAMPKITGLERQVEQAVGRVEPPNVRDESQRRSSRRIYEMELRREVNEQYLPAFGEVARLLGENQLRRPPLVNLLSIENETNRFLNWLRLNYVRGDQAWQSAERKSEADRRAEILKLGAEWQEAQEDRIPDLYFEWLGMIEQTFGTTEAITSASKEQITRGLISLPAFADQLRFTRGGLENLPEKFWQQNEQDVERVRRSLTHLTHGPGDFIYRLHDLLFDRRYKLSLFGRFCALELYGTIKPNECPPMNGRMAKVLRYLGFDVRGS